MAKDRENLNIVVVGHVDHGKSTLIGRLLYDTGSLPNGEIEKVKRISEENGKKFEYAYLLDAFEEEQKQGITIDITMLQFFTKKRDYVIIDAPGHKEFLKNMISGAASAEAAILVIDAKEGVQEQSKRHGYILSLLGIKKVFVAINKMDLVDYSEERFNEVEREFNEFLNNINIYPERYIPISASKGDNVANKSDRMPWYNGENILESMDSIEKDKGIEEKELRFPIQDVYKFDSRRIIAGRIESGTLRNGDEIVIYPSGKTTKVKSIEAWQDKDRRDVVTAGMSVGITVEDEFYNKRGEFICHKDHPVTVGNVFNANVFWLGENNLVKDKTYKLKIETQEEEFNIISINKIIDASTLNSSSERNFIKKNDVAEVTIKTKKPICFDKFSELQSTGRFVIVDGYDISGGGIVSAVEDSLKREIKDIRSKNISIRKRLVSRKDREKNMGQKGKVIWLTGLPGCGKNEIAVKLEKKIMDLGKKVYYIDSSHLRFGLSSDLAFEPDDAHEQTRRIAEVANLFADSGMITIVTSVSRFRSDRQYAKDIIGEKNYIEIFVDADNDICKKRNPSVFKEDSESVFKYERADYPVITLYIDKAEFNSDKKVEDIVDILEY
ncbi:MAG: GTP-binding protein [Clostridium sp.]|jgi:bifunctional enzyme CysN/CysC/sulfate adenylyltransferase subunit 1|uniref:GTP-binding protein n=1 Tax=Clostridium sp. TaxID=1506 RepID=UPI0025BC40B2|nr:GTP-binding protein [Clostridium sp.]MCH3963205.1 GTP-binding protein [Clostridium sp.]MCI1716332.1 GTP-binding protein [Clostridium sp.]MCI1800672.1 GTP-binding protein [Clostridium sp.]MCI1814673.1 GTP-binding protein [Clostridium sp.]MCI1871583.1 GTP-binding protein [Clostridium sp.]